MTSYQYRKSHCGDKTILRPSYLHNEISYTGKMTSSYWIGALIVTTVMKLLRKGLTLTKELPCQFPWWHHDMDTFCIIGLKWRGSTSHRWNPPQKGTEMLSFYVFVVFRWISNCTARSSFQWIETPYDAHVANYHVELPSPFQWKPLLFVFFILFFFK